MKKVSILLALALVLTISVGVSANSAGDMEFVGGVTYNTFDLTETGNGETYEWPKEADDMQSGIGFYGGVLYWINSDTGIEAGLDYASSSYDFLGGLKLKNNIVGPYTQFAYQVNESIRLKAGGAYYSQGMSVSGDSENLDIIKGRGLGFLIGGEISYPVDNDFNVLFNVNYRKANLNINEVIDDDTDDLVDVSNDDIKFDLSGLRLGFGIEYKF